MHRTKGITIKTKSNPLPKKNIKNGKKQSTSNPQKAYADLKRNTKNFLVIIATWDYLIRAFWWNAKNSNFKSKHLKEFFVKN